MNRSEVTGLAVAVTGHAVLFGLLSVGFLSTPNPAELTSTPIDIALVDEISLKATSPNTTEAPMPAEAPEVGTPEDAPPEPAPAEQPAPAPPAPEPAPAPAPVPKAAPAPKRPAERPRPAPERPKAAPAPKAAPKAPVRNTGANPAKKARPRASRLGDDFAKSLADAREKGTATAPRAPQVGAQVVANLGQAIARQVQPCADRIPDPGPGANEIRSRIRLQMREDGTMAARPTVLGQTGLTGENRRYAQRVAELAIAAFIQCAPYRLPAEYYGVSGGWQDITINYRLP